VIERPPQLFDRGVDAILRFAGTETEVAIEIKSRANAAAAWQLVHYAAEHNDRPILLIAEHTTAEARQILQSHGIAVLDGLGNAHIALPGLLFHLEGRRGKDANARPAGPPTRLRGKAGVATQALLLDTERRWRVQDLAERASISKGLAHRVLTRLERDGLVHSQGTGPRRFRRVFDPAALLDLWIEENVDRPALRRGYVLAQTPRQLIKDLGRKLERAHLQYAITGAAATSLVAPFVSALPVIEVWVEEKADEKEVLTQLNAEPVSDGHNVVVMQGKDDVALAFREKRDGVWVPNMFRLYADLRRDPRRGIEQAARLREELIGF
jgi:hypothetical protein